MDCVYCDSSNVIKNGIAKLASGKEDQRYFCKDCGSNFRGELEVTEVEYEDNLQSCERTDDWLKENIFSKKRLVITSAQNNTEINSKFLKSLELYVQTNDANLLVVPIKYKVFDDTPIYDSSIEKYLCGNNIEFPNYKLKIYSTFGIQPTTENPINGIDMLSKGHSIIIGHPQVQLKTVPNLDRRVADIISTTGSVTLPNYSMTKVGEKARFNHAFSAVVIEFGKTFHLRHLNWDDQTESFCDLDKQYSEDLVVNDVGCIALVTGDEHAIFRDSNVEYHTYTSDHSLVSLMRPEYIIRHDSLDAYAVSHHHKHNVFTQYAKWKSGMCSIENELHKTVEYINRTTPDFSTSIIVQSNHNEHLLRWLNEVDIKTEPWNAKVYHYLMYQMLEKTEMGLSGTEHPDPFELIASPWLKENVQFCQRSGMKVMGIEVGQHGDRGINGARGSALSFAKVPTKMIVGHSHSPQINKGCYVVGTSSMLALEYNKGASTWHHAHCIIHRNGKRQMIFITNDGWKLKG